MITNFENKLTRTLIDTGATHSYAVPNIIEKINLLDSKNFRSLLNKLIVANGDNIQ